jgi:hypothetical protein
VTLPSLLLIVASAVGPQDAASPAQDASENACVEVIRCRERLDADGNHTVLRSRWKASRPSDVYDPMPGSKADEQVHVASGSCLTLRKRAEDADVLDTMASGDSPDLVGCRGGD